jgi:uroporphyrinogen decarboxylase
MEDPTDSLLYEELEKLVARKGTRAVVAKTRLGLSAMLMSMDLVGFSLALYDDPEVIEIILKRYLKWFACASKEMIRRGADLIWCFDDFAYRSGPMMSPAVFREMLVPILLPVTRDISVPWIFHSDGNLNPILLDLLRLGMNGLHPIEPECMSLADLKSEIGNKVCLIGNVSVDVLSRGTAEETRLEIARCFREGSPGGGYMISSSNSIPCYAIPKNVKVMIEEINIQRKEW